MNEKTDVHCYEMFYFVQRFLTPMNVANTVIVYSFREKRNNNSFLSKIND